MDVNSFSLTYYVLKTVYSAMLEKLTSANDFTRHRHGTQNLDGYNSIFSVHKFLPNRSKQVTNIHYTWRRYDFIVFSVNLMTPVNSRLT